MQEMKLYSLSEAKSFLFYVNIIIIIIIIIIYYGHHHHHYHHHYLGLVCVGDMALLNSAWGNIKYSISMNVTVYTIYFNTTFKYLYIKIWSMYN